MSSSKLRVLKQTRQLIGALFVSREFQSDKNVYKQQMSVKLIISVNIPAALHQVYNLQTISDLNVLENQTFSNVFKAFAILEQVISGATADHGPRGCTVAKVEATATEPAKIRSPVVSYADDAIQVMT